MQKNTRPAFDEQAFWTGNTATQPVVYDFHLTEPGPDSSPGIEAQDDYEPHTPIIHAAGFHAADEAELSDDEIDEFEARLYRDDLQSVRLHVSNALRSAQGSRED
ncbi:MAG: hypothetical protein H0W99_17095 [Acidobacteria bacterium]|nr:hypothetical protein [Acidobacteriota bacterium]